MQPRMLKSSIGQYVKAEWSGVNTSGIYPLGEELLVLPDKPHEKTAGGIITTTTTQEVQAAGAMTGIVVAVGEDAFQWNRTRTKPSMGQKPKSGDHIIFQRYAGQLHMGLDGVEYRILSDMSVAGMYLEPESK